MARKPADLDILSRIGFAPEKPSRTAKDKNQVVVEMPGLERYGALHKVKKELEDGFLETEGAPIKSAMWVHFITEGVMLGRCPENFKGHEGLAGDASSLQIRRKDTRTTLKPEDVARFDEHEIPLEHEMSRPFTLRVKPDVFAANRKYINKMMLFLEQNGYATDEIFEMQDEKSRWIVGVNTLDKLFEKAKNARDEAREAGSNKPDDAFSDDLIRELLDICAGLTIAPKWDGTFAEAFAITRRILAPTPKEQEADVKAAQEKAAADAAAAKAKPARKAAAKVAPKVDPVIAAMAGALAAEGAPVARSRRPARV